MNIWVIAYVSVPCVASIVVQPSTGNYISVPYSITSIGTAPNIQCYASGSSIIPITGATTFTIVAQVTSIPSGAFYSRNSQNSYVSFTRLA